MSKAIKSLAGLSAFTIATAAYAGGSRFAIEHTIVAHVNARSDVFAQSEGPVIVMLPSLGRSVRDLDEVADRFGRAGSRVVRSREASAER